MIGIDRRGLRLEWKAALAVALGAALLMPAANAQTATTTTLTVDANGLATATVRDVLNHPATGVVSFVAGGHTLAQGLLDGNGQLSERLALVGGEQQIQAVYSGEPSHLGSNSVRTTPRPLTGGTPGFQLSLTAVSPSTLPMTLTAGQSGSLTVTVTPVNNSSLTSPMFVTLSCSGLPTYGTCAFEPEEVEITSTTPTSCAPGSPASACPPTSLMVIETDQQTGKLSPVWREQRPVSWAILLPGLLTLGGVAWGARRRRWLQRLSVMALLALVTTLGTTGCNPLYHFYNHGPPITPATPAGTYTITITAQSSNGVTATSNSTTMVLTVD